VTYDRIFLLFIRRRELSDNLTFREVASIHSLVVCVGLALFEPNRNDTKLPSLWPFNARIQGDEMDGVLAIDEIKRG